MSVSLYGSGQTVVQIQQAVSNTAFSTTTPNTDITGLSVTITPQSTSNKILVMYDVVYGNGSSQPYSGINLFCNGTWTPQGTTAGGQTAFTSPAVLANPTNPENETRTYSFHYIHSPASTSALTYKLQVGSILSSRTVYINTNSPSAGQYSSGVSQITVVELAYA